MVKQYDSLQKGNSGNYTQRLKVYLEERDHSTWTTQQLETQQ